MARGPSTKTINKETVILSIRIKCGNCGRTANYKRERVTFYGHSWEGDHISGGSVDMNVECMFCKQNLTPEIESW